VLSHLGHNTVQTIGGCTTHYKYSSNKVMESDKQRCRERGNYDYGYG